MDLVTSLTRDGGLIQQGPTFYLLARMADPGEKVTVVDAEPKSSSLIDGQPLMRFIVENHRGERFIVEPWQLSRVPADELYKQLREQEQRRQQLPSPQKIPVSLVRLAG